MKESNIKLELGAAGLLLLLLSFFLAPSLVDKGYYRWEGNGDAKFYAQCAKDMQQGELRWCEVYPIALQKGKPAKMSWLAVAHPLSIRAIMFLGLEAEEATIVASVSAYILMLLLLYVIGVLAGGHWKIGMGLCFAGILLPAARGFSYSGLSESISQLWILVTLVFMVLYIKEIRFRNLALLFAAAFIGLWCRPHNQFLFIALFALIFIGEPRQKLSFALAWLTIFFTWSILKRSLIEDDEIVFPYLFSFLVNTPNHMGHEIFREYRGAFTFQDLWTERDQLWHKIFAGWYLMKQYWTGWLPQVCVLLLALWKGKAKLLSFCALLVMAASIFFAAMGHMVPRYWEMLEPLTLAVVALSWVPFWNESTRTKKGFCLAASLILILLGALKLSTPQIKSDLNDETIPAEIVKLLPEKGLIASDKPSRLISSVKRTILLLPETLDDLERLQLEVETVESIVLTPGLAKGEQKVWLETKNSLSIMGYKRKMSKDGWEVYNRVIEDLE